MLFFAFGLLALLDGWLVALLLLLLPAGDFVFLGTLWLALLESAAGADFVPEDLAAFAWEALLPAVLFFVLALLVDALAFDEDAFAGVFFADVAFFSSAPVGFAGFAAFLVVAEPSADFLFAVFAFAAVFFAGAFAINLPLLLSLVDYRRYRLDPQAGVLEFESLVHTSCGRGFVARGPAVHTINAMLRNKA